MRRSLRFAGIALFFLIAFQSSFGQGTGVIIRSAGLSASQTILDPVAPSGYTSKTSAGFGNNDVANSKLPFKPIVAFSNEPFGDLRRGPDHRFSDFVPDENGSGVYVHSDGANLLFRMRMGAVVPGAKGYSILIDSDGKFGATGANADPNYQAATTGVNGNPGFEIEVDLFTQNSSSVGIAIYDVDGTSNPVLRKSYTNWLNYSQISIAGTNDNGDPDVFLDFYIPISDLTTLFGVTASTPLRMNATTVMAPLPAIGGPKSDIYGSADNDYRDANAQWEMFINAQPPFTLSSLNNSGTAAVGGPVCTAPPTVTAATAAVSTAQVQGTWSSSSLAGAATSARIYVYINGSVTPSNPSGTLVSSGGNWTVSGLTIAGGDLITAKAQATGESLCLVSNTFRVTTCSNPSARPVTPAMSCLTTSKGTGGTNKTTGWTIWTTNITRNQTDNSVNNAGTTGATFGAETGTSPNINWAFSSGCSGGSNMTSGSYRFWYTDANGCASDPVLVCVAGNGPNSLASPTPLIAPSVTSPAAFTTITKSMTGTASSGSTVNLYINGVLTASTTTSGTISTSTTGTFTFTGLTLNNGDVISLTNEYNTGTVSTSYCGSKGATTYTVGCYTAPPVMATDAVTGLLKIGQPINGTSGEPAGTTIRLYNSANALLATTAVLSNGSWTTTGATYSNGFTGNAVASTTYYATATRGACISVASGNASTAAGTTSARCGSIATTPLTISTTAISGTLTGTAATGTVVNLYEDGFLLGSFTTGNNNWGPIDVTNKLYSGNGTSTGILTIGIQESGQEEIVCLTKYAVTCTGPITPSYTQQSSNGTTGADATVPTGGTMTYTITNLAPNTFYSVADANTGRSYASGVWTSGSVTPSSNITVTTYPLTASGTYSGVVKATSLTAADMCTALAATSSFKVLPVTIVALKGTHQNKANTLTWKTASEGNAIRFEVERSTSGVRFEAIGSVKANGSNSTYNFEDNRLTSPTNYYRLRMVEADGNVSYSRTIVVKETGNSLLLTTVRPNPFVNGLSVSLSLDKAVPVTISLLDVAGRVVTAKQITTVPGLNHVTLTGLAGLSKGLYVVNVSVDGMLLQEKILK